MKVLLFAALREVVREDRIDVTVNPGDTAARVWEELVRRHPGLAPYSQRTRVAVNGVYASMERPVSESDELVFFPPVSGGLQ